MHLFVQPASSIAQPFVWSTEWSVALRLVELRVIDQRELCFSDFPAILISESIDPLPLAARVTVVPVVPPVAWFAGHGREGLARAVVALVVYLQLSVALYAAPDNFALER